MPKKHATKKRKEKKLIVLASTQKLFLSSVKFWSIVPRVWLWTKDPLVVLKMSPSLLENMNRWGS